MKKIFIPLLVMLLVVSSQIVAADGMPIPSDYKRWESLIETHQLVYFEIDPTTDRTKVDMFISIKDISDSSSEIRWVMPFKEKPLGFDLYEENYSRFNKTFLKDIENDFKMVNDAKQAPHIFRRTVGKFYQYLLFGPFEKYWYAPIGFYKASLEESNRGAGWIWEETYYTGHSMVAVYHAFSEQGLKDLLKHLSLPENLLKGYEKYSDMYLYVARIQPQGLVEKKTTSYLEENCPKTYERMIQSLKQQTYPIYRKIEIEPHRPYYNQDYWIRQCVQECDNCSTAKVAVAVQELINELEEAKEKGYDELGLHLSYILPLEDGQFWYPLGTGETWKEVTDTRIYGVVPFDYDITAVYPRPTDTLSLNKSIFKWSYQRYVPADDIVVAVKRQGEAEKNEMLAEGQKILMQIRSVAFFNEKTDMSVLSIYFLIGWFVSAFVLWKKFLGKKTDKYFLKEAVVLLLIFVAVDWAINFIFPLYFLGLIVSFGAMVYRAKKALKLDYPKAIGFVALLLFGSFLIFKTLTILTQNYIEALAPKNTVGIIRPVSEKVY